MEELRLQTPVREGKSGLKLSIHDKMTLLGSCFADNIGERMKALGLDVLVNPFGTIYNPVSIRNSVARLSSGAPFTEKDCVPMGAGAGLVCSFSHHTSFARPTAAEFLDNANAALGKASEAWKASTKVIITLGTAWCFESVRTGEIVSNCLKIDSKEFRRRRLDVGEVTSLLKSLVGRFPEKDFIFTVSPVRHLKDGAHGNQVSKGTLLLAVDNVVGAYPERADYFPAYEIVMDELRDYRFYAPDMVHLTDQATGHIWERFALWAFPESEIPELEERRRSHLASCHRPHFAL